MCTSCHLGELDGWPYHFYKFRVAEEDAKSFETLCHSLADSLLDAKPAVGWTQVPDHLKQAKRSLSIPDPEGNIAAFSLRARYSAVW